MKRKTTEDQLIARLWFLICVLAAAIVLTLFTAAIIDVIRNLRPAEMPEEHTQVVVEDVPLAGATAIAESVEVGGWEEYVEGEGPAPAWWNPDEPMAAEWFASCDQVTESNSDNCSASLSKFLASSQQVKDIGCPDWNLDTTLWGWDGHTAEVWEIDLFSRVFYLEFYGASLPCCEAGCDAMLRLWDSGLYGRTLFDALSHYDPDYGYTYEVYPWVWETDFDADGLAWCRAFCEERFCAGPQWSAMYFQLGGYHDPDWVTPAYEIDGVYFSIRED